MEKLVEEPVEGGAPECKVLAYFTDGNVHPHLEISERRIRYYHTPGDIGFREFQLHGVYFAARTKLNTLYERQFGQLLEDVREGRDHTILLYGADDEDKQKMLFGQVYELGLMHIHLKQLLAELILEERLERVEVSFVCYIQGLFYDLLNHCAKLEWLPGSGSFHLLQARANLTTFKDYIKLVRMYRQNMQQLLRKVQRNKVNNECNHTLLIEVTAWWSGVRQRTLFVRFGHESNIKNNYKKIENWSIRLNNLLRDERYERSLEADDAFLRMMAELVYRSGSRFTVLLALNGRYGRASEYLNCLHFGSYFHRINPLAKTTNRSVEALLSYVDSLKDQTLEIDVPAVTKDLSQIAAWLTELRMAVDEHFLRNFQAYEKLILRDCQSELFQGKFLQQQEPAALVVRLSKRVRSFLLDKDRNWLDAYDGSGHAIIKWWLELAMSYCTEPKLRAIIQIVSHLQYSYTFPKGILTDSPDHTPTQISIAQPTPKASQHASLLPRQPTCKAHRSTAPTLPCLDDLISLSFSNSSMINMNRLGSPRARRSK